jgi:GNAT superfamily N-acetyltransferase
LFWHASRRAELRLTGATVRTWTGHETWPTGRAVVIHADPWRLGIRKVRQAIAAAGSPDAGLPNPLDQLDRLARAADGSHERASLTLADDRRAFLGFATLGRRVLPRRDRIDYELDLMFLWVHPAARGQGLGAALAAAIGMTSLADYRAMAVRTAAPLPVATLLFADFLTPSGAATGRRAPLPASR